MQIASAFLMGTKIKEIDVPAEPWTKITKIPTVQDPNGYCVAKAGHACGNLLYVISGNSQNGSAAQDVDLNIRAWNGSSWGNPESYSIPASEYTWNCYPGNSLFRAYEGNPCFFMFRNYSGFSNGQNLFMRKLSSMFTPVTADEAYPPMVHQECELNGDTYWFCASYRGSWNPVYWFDIYWYVPRLNYWTKINTANMFDGEIDHNITYGYPQILTHNGLIHIFAKNKHHLLHIEKIEGPEEYEFTLTRTEANDTPNSQNSGMSSFIVYKNKIHAFLPSQVAWSTYYDGHYEWNEVSDTWEKSDDIPWASLIPTLQTTAAFATKPVIFKNKLYLLGTQSPSISANDEFDYLYRYNK